MISWNWPSGSREKDFLKSLMHFHYAAIILLLEKDMTLHSKNKRPIGHLSIGDCTDFLSEGFIFTYQHSHNEIYKNQQWPVKAA